MFSSFDGFIFSAKLEQQKIHICPYFYENNLFMNKESNTKLLETQLPQNSVVRWFPEPATKSAGRMHPPHFFS